MPKQIIAGLALMLTATISRGWSSEEQMWLSKVEQAYGDRAALRLSTWRQTVAELSRQTELEKLRGVNAFLNQFEFIDDAILWGKKDYWSTPLEFIGVGGGDCEDFTIAKYFSLLELGIEDRKLRIVYGKALELDQFHMVLAYYETPESVPLLLDNLDFRLLPASQRPDILPIYSFNSEHLWLIKENQQSTVTGKASRLSLWSQVRERQLNLALRQPKISLDL